jgi:CRISPR type IV-associated protein Csf2
MAYIINATGTLTAETPISVSPPDHFDERPKRLHKLPRMVEYREGSPVQVPVIPASTMRGVLRHALTGFAFGELGGAGTFTVADYVNTAQGGVVDRKAEGEDKPIDFTRSEALRTANPVIGLFGNFGDKMPSRLLMRHAALERPEDIFTVASQVRTDPVERDADIRRLFSKDDLFAFSQQMETRRQFVRLEDKAGRLEKRLKDIADGREEVDGDKVKELKADFDQTKKDHKSLEEGAGGSVNLQQLTPEAEAIAPGATMRHGFTLNGVTLTEASAALLAIEVWVSGGAIVGAMKRNGFGRISGFYDLDARPAHGAARLAPPVNIGRVRWDATGFAAETGAGTLLSEIVAEKERLKTGGMITWRLKAS